MKKTEKNELKINSDVFQQEKQVKKPYFSIKLGFFGKSIEL